MRPRQFTDDEMLAETRRQLLQHGPSITTDKIAAALGVTSAALFRRAGSKRELMVRALIPEHGAPKFVQALLAGPDDRPVRDQLLAIGAQIDAFFASVVPLLAVMRAARLDPREIFRNFDEPPPVRAVRALCGWLAQVHAQGRLHVTDPEAAAMGFIGGLQSRHFINHACGRDYALGGDGYVESFVSIFHAGLAPRATEGE